MAFEEVKPAAPAAPAAPTTPYKYLPNHLGLSGQWGPTYAGSYGMAGLAGLGYRPQQPQTPAQPTYNYTPPKYQPPPNLQVTGDLYSNPNAPWAIPMQGQQGGGTQQPPSQGATNVGGWDSSAFMQGLQSLGFQGY